MAAREFKLIAGRPTIDRDPQDVLDYYVRFTTWLPDGDTITAKTAVGTGVTVDSSAISGGDIQIWVSGGTLGETASVTVHITTAGGRQKDQTVYFKIKRN